MEAFGPFRHYVVAIQHRLSTSVRMAFTDAFTDGYSTFWTFFLVLTLPLAAAGCGTDSAMDSSSYPTAISLDGAFNDWERVDPLHTDPAGDGDRVDLLDLSVAHDADFLYVRFRLGDSMLLQEKNDLELRLDLDANPSTGSGDGTDLSWTFGSRSGTLHGDGTRSLTHADLGFSSLPTVASSTYELAFQRSATPGGTEWLGEDDTFCVHLTVGGDRLPDDGRVCYTLSGDTDRPELLTSIPAKIGGLRLISYNVQRDVLFTEAPAEAYRRIFAGVAPDIFALQEVYENDADATRDRIAELTETSDDEWYTAKAGRDLVVISRYPVLDTYEIPGFEDYASAAHLLDTRSNLGQPLLLINMHPPCCNGGDPSSDLKRQRVVDAVAAFLRDTQQGNGPIDAPDQTPLVILGDMNFVGDAQQPATLADGTIINRAVHGESAPPDWDGSSLLDVNPPQTGAPLHTTWIDLDSRFPPGRLDYAYVSDSVLRVEQAFVLETARLSSSTDVEPGDTRTASDHLPIILDVSAK